MTNQERAERARKTLIYYFNICDDCPEEYIEAFIGELLSDVMHYCDTKNVDFNYELKRAVTNYTVEAKNPYIDND